VTSVSRPETAINIFFFRNAASIYGEQGLTPSTPASAGIDLRACLIEGDSLFIPAGERQPVPSGIAVEPTIPGIAGFVYSRSGLGAVKGLAVAQGVGVIDPDYRGEITVFLLNTGKKDYTVQNGERIAQLVFQPYIRPLFIPAVTLGTTNRGAGGFGHTGTR
jgi:dUTP pyrophosphatase